MGTVNSLSGTLPATLTYSARKWFWVPAVPGAYADPRDGTLTIVLTEAAGGKIQRDSYGVAEEVAIGILGRRFLLMNDTDANQPDVYGVTIGPHPSCTCLGWKGGRAESCKHVDALGSLLVALMGGPTAPEPEATAPEPQPQPQPPALAPASTARQDLKPSAPSTRRPPKARKRIEEPTVRVSVDAVTHVKTVTVLDDVQKAFEQATRGIEGALLKLSNGDVQRVIPRLEEWLRRMKPHSD